MISRDPECECEISAEMIWAGPAIQLCHHSTVAEAEKVQEKLMDLMTNFSQNIDANSMFDKTSSNWPRSTGSRPREGSNKC